MQVFYFFLNYEELGLMGNVVTVWLSLQKQLQMLFKLL
jgi:hypothetical protein